MKVYKENMYAIKYKLRTISKFYRISIPRHPHTYSRVLDIGFLEFSYQTVLDYRSVTPQQYETLMDYPLVVLLN